MNDSHIISIAQIKDFLKLDQAIKFKSVSGKERSLWINEALNKFRYFGLRKKEKGVVRNYIAKMTSLSQSQLTRSIERKKRLGKVFFNSTSRRHFPFKYAPRDIALLCQTDNLHEKLSGPATKKILEREYKIFNKKDYQTISQISSSHIYNLRATRQYQSHSFVFRKTKPIKSSIGERRKPEPEARPGFLRVDTVHQGDAGQKKGIYHINLVDETTQWEIVGAVEKISERFLAPLLENLIAQFPFKIINFHSDNGSEFINKVVAGLLNKLLIQQTKSRARRSNDNALAESKNGAVIRKHLGYRYVPQSLASTVNRFYQEYFNVYLNYHRPSGFATVITDKKGKEKKIYEQKNYLTPYAKLKSLKNPEQYLKEKTTFKALDQIAYSISDNDFAEKMQQAKGNLFKNLKHIPQEITVCPTFISCSYVD